MQLVWKASNTVGFGIRGDWVVAWYCPKGNTDGAKDNEVNVCPVGGCIDDCVDPVPLKDGYSSCFNRRAQRDLNIHKKAAKVDKVKYDVEVAKRAQKYALQSSSGQALTAGSDACDYVLYYPTSTKAPTMSKDDQVIKSWYDENTKYDFKTNAAKVGEVADKFETMMWKPSVKVGFGFVIVPVGASGSSAAVGLFCPPTGKPKFAARDRKTGNECNICPPGGCTSTKCGNKKPDPPKPDPDSKLNKCASASGNYVEISWNADVKRVEFNGRVNRNQWFSVGLAKDIDTSNQLLFMSKAGKLSDVADA